MEVVTSPSRGTQRVAASRSVLLAALLSAASPALAKPEGPSILCDTYPDAAQCMGRAPDCQICHISTAPPSWNSYGLAIQAALPRTGSFGQELPVVLRSLADADSDGDGASNLDELTRGTLPGDALSLPPTAAEPGDQNAEPNPDYEIGKHDVAFAYKRVSVLYCGHSPSYEEMRPFRDAQTSADAKKGLLHERLEACLDSQYWQREGLMRLADDRIRPITNLGTDSNVVITIPLETLNGRPELKSSMGDYNYDYRLWVHVLTGNRDARDLVLAQYFVEESEDGTWRTTEEIIPNTRDDVTASGQLLEKSYRAGMLSTMWFITRNTMFAELPRTTAAAAYRAYLGSDIAKMQGLLPVAGEPDDIDNKGVDNERCAVCHSTLDPLAYAFASYNGFEFNDDLAVVADLFIAGSFRDFARFGMYNPNRPATRMPGWSATEQQPYLLGQKISGLREFAQVAAESDEYARNLATIFFSHALTREPDAEDLPELTTLWQSLPGDNFSANKLIHRLVDTQAFGAP